MKKGITQIQKFLLRNILQHSLQTRLQKVILISYQYFYNKHYKFTHKGASAVIFHVHYNNASLSLKEQPSHTSAHRLSVIKYIKSVHKLINTIAAFCYSAQICHQCYIVALIIEMISKLRRGQKRQPIS